MNFWTAVAKRSDDTALGGAERGGSSAGIPACGFTKHPCFVFRTGSKDAPRTRTLEACATFPCAPRNPKRRGASLPAAVHKAARAGAGIWFASIVMT